MYDESGESMEPMEEVSLTSRLNLSHGAKKWEKKKIKIKIDTLRSIGKESGEVSPGEDEDEEESYDGKDLQKMDVLSLE